MKPKKKTAPGRRTVRSSSVPPRQKQPSSHQIRRAPVKKSSEPSRQELETKERAASGDFTVGTETLKVPSILLEGDEPSPSTTSGPGLRYALSPTAPPVAAGELGELPEAYGTERLLLAARDPHWLYAQWDLTREQQREYNRRSVDGHLVLRVFSDQVAGQPLVETHLNPESRNWFVHVGRGGTKFVGVLGYYAKTNARWTQLSVSAPTVTPPDSLSPDTSVQFATIPVGVPFEKLLATVKAAVGESVPLAQAVHQLRGEDQAQKSGARWTPEQERALAELISQDVVRRLCVGSMEMSELIQRRLAEALSSIAVASVSSPFGHFEGRTEFWFKVNTDLVVYGATQPDARVAIGGREIRLQPDGSFSFRFALPDGHHQLPITAVSADQTEVRAVELRFDRQSEYRGDVEALPHDTNLKPPRAESVS